MELARCQRLLGALEILCKQASIALKDGQLDALISCLERSERVLQDLAPLAQKLEQSGHLSVHLKKQGAELIEQHRKLSGQLETLLQNTKLELDQSRGARNRLRHLRPAYTPFAQHLAEKSSGRLNGVG